MRFLNFLLLLSFSFHPIFARKIHSPITTTVPYEIRAVWLTTLYGLDWPQHPATNEKEAEQQKNDLRQMLDKLQEAGINTVLFQTRLRGTVAYPSKIEPWDAAFSGKAGRAPIYDPLAFALEECHKRGMEFHAWVVAFPLCKVAAVKQLGKAAIPKSRPNLCKKCGDQYMLNPGEPEIADYLAKICQEIATNYDVDGIHLDYIRYPEPNIPFNDDDTYRKYGNGETKATWRTQNINRCVKKIHHALKSIRPWIKMSCSPVGKYSDLTRYSSHGWNARDAVSQDAQYWLKEGWMDILFPMMYYDGDNYYPFLADWRENDSNRLIVPGLGIWFLNKQEKNWPLLTIQRQMNVARQIGLSGICFFRTKYFLNNEKGLYDWCKNSFFANRALIPPLTGSDSIAPTAPIVSQHIKGDMLNLTWKAVSDSTPITYNVYRLDSIYGDVLLASRLRQTHYESLLYLPALRHSKYVVTAVDAWGNESEVTSAKPTD